MFLTSLETFNNDSLALSAILCINYLNAFSERSFLYYLYNPIIVLLVLLIITKGDWWMGMGAFGFSSQSALLIRDKFFSITKNKDKMKQGIDLKDAIDALTDLIIGKKTKSSTKKTTSRKNKQITY